MARTPTQKELAAFVVAHGITDFITGGRLSLLERNALWKVIKKLGPPAVSTTGRLAGQAAMAVPRLAGTAARGVRFVTMRHPYIAAAVVTFEAVRNRDKIAQLASEGWEVVEPQVSRSRDTLSRAFAEATDPQTYIDAYRERPGLTGLGRPEEMIFEGLRRKKKKSKYNRAVSAAMKAVKNSTKGGKKGVISAPKRVFSTVSKAVSKVNKGAKVSSKGISGIAARAARRILGKPKKKPKKTSKGYTITVNR